jgi:hypothetical protein
MDLTFDFDGNRKDLQYLNIESLKNEQFCDQE